MKLSVVVPVYNEEKEITNTFNKLNSALTKVKGLTYEIIFVNDCSKDRSLAKIRTIKSSKLRVLSHPYNKGYGSSLKTGISTAKYEWIAITDADGTYPVDKLPELLKYTKNYDMVVGDRDKSGVPWLRRPPKFVLRKIAGMLCGRKIPDLNSGLRVFRKKECQRFWSLYPPGFSFTSTITMAYFTNGLTVKYLPIPYYKRTGKSSIHPIKDTIGFFNLLFRMIVYFRPLRFFAVPALIFFIGFLVSLIHNIFVLGNITDTTTLLLITGFNIFFLGLVADLMVKRMPQQ